MKSTIDNLHAIRLWQAGCRLKNRSDVTKNQKTFLLVIEPNMNGIRHPNTPSVTWLVRYLLFLASLVQIFSICRAEEFKFEVSEVEKKPYHLGGYAEVNPILFGLDRDSRLYRLRFYNRDEGSTLEQYGGTLQLEGSYEKGISRLSVRTNSNLQHTYEK